jgi:signal transduction histidine kinase
VDDGGDVPTIIGPAGAQAVTRAAEERPMDVRPAGVEAAAREAALRLALRATGVGTWRYRPAVDELEVDGPMAVLLGLPDHATVRSLRLLLDLVHPDDRDVVEAALRAPGEHGVPLEVDLRVVHTRSPRRLKMRGRRFAANDQEPAFVTGTAVDITEQWQQAQIAREHTADLTDLLAAAHSDVRHLAHRLLEAQEEERHHVARELHDEVGQSLTALDLHLATVAGDPEVVAGARDIVHRLIEAVSSLSMQLRPVTLDTLGLMPAVREHLGRFAPPSGIEVDLRHEGMDRRFAPDVEITAYRVVQESLTNVSRHAEARTVRIVLVADDDVLRIVVRDDGRGFDHARVLAEGGLGGLVERVHLVGGQLDVESAPGAGTTIIVELPLVDDPTT